MPGVSGIHAVASEYLCFLVYQISISKYYLSLQLKMSPLRHCMDLLETLPFPFLLAQVCFFVFIYVSPIDKSYISLSFVS